jgi:CMP-N,N'-diacetyllegionaminic acid synthase
MNETKFIDTTWAFIPARGGSKSITLKNMIEMGGRPLIDYVIQSAKASSSVARIFCSTDHEKIADFCRKRGVNVYKRPTDLAGDNIDTLDVIIYFLETLIREEGSIAEILLLLEPTSPFVLPAIIDDCVNLLRNNHDADSVQTITTIPPNHHAFNQRYIKDGFVHFRFPEERVGHFTKQSKPEFYVHGNLRVMKCASLLEKRDIYGDISLPYMIPRFYAMDVDGPEDLVLAELYLSSKKVILPHLHDI